jgi:hypothetical protein
MRGGRSALYGPSDPTVDRAVLAFVKSEPLHPADLHDPGGWGGEAQSRVGARCSGVDDAVNDCALKADLLRLLASIGVEAPHRPML